MHSLLNIPTPTILALLFISFQTPAAPVSIDTSSINPDASTQSTLRRIGGTISNTSRPYEGIGNQIAVLPYLELDHGKFSVSGLNLGYKLSDSTSTSWKLMAVPRFLGYKESDSPVLAGLDDTHYSIHAGLSFTSVAGTLNYNAQLLTDVLGESGGTELIGTVSKTFLQNKLAFVPSLSVHWQNEQLVDHYYGVSTTVATSTRPAYSANAALNFGVSLLASYAFNDKIDFIGVARTDRFGSEITNSPIVANDTTTSATIGLLYSF